MLGFTNSKNDQPKAPNTVWIKLKMLNQLKMVKSRKRMRSNVRMLAPKSCLSQRKKTRKPNSKTGTIHGDDEADFGAHLCELILKSAHTLYTQLSKW